MATNKKVSSGSATEASATVAESTEDMQVAVTVAVVYPKQVMLANNGSFAISEPVSGAFLAAGGSQRITLHDEAHASRVWDNLRELVRLNHLSGALTADGVPIVNE